MAVAVKCQAGKSGVYGSVIPLDIRVPGTGRQGSRTGSWCTIGRSPIITHARGSDDLTLSLFVAEFSVMMLRENALNE